MFFTNEMRQYIREELTNALHPLAVINDKLDSVLSHLHNLERKVDRLMALADDLKAGIKKLDDETTAIGDVINGLVAKLQTGNLSATEEAEVFSALNAVSDRLAQLGKDPTNPVPPEPPALTQARATAGK